MYEFLKNKKKEKSNSKYVNVFDQKAKRKHSNTLGILAKEAKDNI